MQQNETRRSGRKPGFALIEVLVALAVVSVGLVTILRTFGTALAELDNTRDQLICERLLREQWAVLEAETVWRSEIAPNSVRGVFAPPDQTFEWERIVRPFPPDESENPDDPLRSRVYDVKIQVRRIGATHGGVSAHSRLAVGTPNR